MEMISKWLLSLALLSGSMAASAKTFTPLFIYPGADNNSSGLISSSVLSQGRDGNLNSTIQTNGVTNDGTVYKMTPTGGYSAVYTFCTEGGACGVREHF